MPLAPPRFIYFDMGNVLLLFDEARAVRQMAELAGASPADVRAIVYESGLQDRYETGLAGWDEIHQAVCRQTGTQPDADRLAHAGSDMFELNVPIVPLVASLSAVGYPLGILSNTCPSHWELVVRRFTILRAYFAPAVLSYEVGAMKPSDAIYRSAVQRVGLDPGEVFFMDDRQENVDAARRCGLDAVHFTSVPALAADLRQRGIDFNF